MKLLPKVLFSLLLTIVAVLAGTYLLPDRVEVEQAVVLDAPPEQVYLYLENPAEWENWSVLNKQEDPSMIHLYGGPSRGKGARLQWSGDVVGEGKLVFTESNSPVSLTYLQTENSRPGPLHGSFSLSAVSGGTRVVWKQSAGLEENPVARLWGVMHRYKKQNEVEKGLSGLKTLLLNNSKKKAEKRKTAYATHH